MNAVALYITIYTFAAIGYVWYRYFFNFLSRQKKYKKNFPKDQNVSVIVPVYNEIPKLLKQSIESILRQTRNIELLVINDGSNRRTADILEQLQHAYKFSYVKFKKNMGKRVAMATGVKRASGDIIAFVDSDTVLKPNAIEELIKPFSNPKMGATTGNATVLNQGKWLGKLIAARYYYAFNVERRSMNYTGVVPVASGVLAAFRKSIILPKIESFLNQKFLGKVQQYGDDRHLTNLVLEQGYKVFYVDSAVALTHAPEKLFQLFKQQMRWRKSYIRETLYAAKFMWKISKMLTFDTLYTAYMTYNSIVMRLMAWAFIFLYPILILPYFIIVTIMAFVHNIALFVERGVKFGLQSILYAYLYELFVFWSLPAAILTLNNTEWGTR